MKAIANMSSGVKGSRARAGIRMYREELDRTIDRRAELAERLSRGEERRDRAQEVLDELDRPLVRRLHRSEIVEARGDLNQAQGTIRQSVAELAKIENER